MLCCNRCPSIHPQLPLSNSDTPRERRFHPTGYDNVFAHSHPAQALRNAKSPNEDWRRVLDRVPHEASDIIYDRKISEYLVCLRCFRPILSGVYTCPCSGCGNLVHFRSCDPQHNSTIEPIKGIALQRSKADEARCAVCANKETWEEWTKSRGPPLSGDYEPEEEELEEEPLDTTLKRVLYKIGEEYHGFG